MTVSLKEVINTFGYIDLSKQIALVKLAAYRGCFDEVYNANLKLKNQTHADFFST